MARNNRGNSGGKIQLYGVTELLQKIEKAGGNADKAVKKCVEASLEQVGMKMQLFMMDHRRTSDTYNSFEILPVKLNKAGKVTGSAGYEVSKGGLPAVFLDVGTPNQQPKFFRYYAINNSRQELEEIQQATLREILEALK